MTHTKPIPDEVLRKIAEIPARIPEPGMPAVVEAVAAERRAMALELLASRDVLRHALGAFYDIAYGLVGPGERWATECAEMIQALLPKPPEAP